MSGPRLIRPIVPIEEWVDSPYYLGPEAGALFPFWKQHLINFFNEGCLELILHGSYSLGKSYVSLIALHRVIYEMSCYENFVGAFGLSPSSKLKLGYVSVSVTKAKDTGIRKLIRQFDNIPYFQENVPRREDTESVLDLGFLEVSYASQVGHLIGEDFYGVVFDEANFVQAAGGEEFQVAQKLYLEARIRGSTRFSKNGVQFGFYGLLSSADQATSFTESRIKEAENDPDIYVVQAATYDVRPEAHATERFQVFTGLDEIEPFIVDSSSEIDRGQIAKTYGMTFEQFLEANKNLVVNVPVNLKKYYVEDITYALKTLSGRTTRGSSKLVKNPAIFRRAFENNNLVNPLSVEIPTLSLFSDDAVADFIDPEKLIANYEDGCALFFHLDMSKSGDRTGLAASYKSEASGKFRTLLKMAIHRHKESDEIDWSKVEDVVYFVLETTGADLGFISYDQYASVYMPQNFKKRFGKERVDLVSMDKDDSHYLLYMFLLKKGLVEHYLYRPFYDDMLKLNHDRASQKVDHGKDGGKDVCDAVVGSISDAFRAKGMSREELVAAQFLTGFYEDSSDQFYEELMSSASTDDGDGFYSGIMRNLRQ